MGYESRDTSKRAQMRRRIERDAQARPRDPVPTVLVQTEFPVERVHTGRKTVRRIARLWVRPKITNHKDRS